MRGIDRSTPTGRESVQLSVHRVNETVPGVVRIRVQEDPHRWCVLTLDLDTAQAIHTALGECIANARHVQTTMTESEPDNGPT